MKCKRKVDMQKKLTLILVVLININYFCYSQLFQNRRADLIQVEYLTKELGLSPAESSKFQPVYSNYKNELRSIRRQEQGDQIVLEEKVLNIRKKYKDDFKSILGSDERVNKLFVAEKSFKEMLRKELIKRNIRRQAQ